MVLRVCRPWFHTMVLRLPNPSGLEPRKSPKRVLKESPGTGLPESRKSVPRSPKRVRKLGFGLFSDSFETPGRTLSGLWGSCPGGSFGTLFGLFRGSAPEGPGRPCAGLVESITVLRIKTGTVAAHRIVHVTTSVAITTLACPMILWQHLRATITQKTPPYYRAQDDKHSLHHSLP